MTDHLQGKERLMKIVDEAGEEFWLPGHDTEDAYAAFGPDVVIHFYLAAFTGTRTHMPEVEK